MRAIRLLTCVALVLVCGCDQAKSVLSVFQLKAVREDLRALKKCHRLGGVENPQLLVAPCAALEASIDKHRKQLRNRLGGDYGEGCLDDVTASTRRFIHARARPNGAETDRVIRVHLQDFDELVRKAEQVVGGG
jgi:hypothetical protein